MGFVALMISLILFFTSLLMFKSKLVNPVAFFLGLWTFILALSCMNLYSLFRPTDEAYIYITLMLVFFFVGSYGYYILCRKGKSEYSIINSKKNSVFNEKIYFACSYVLIVVLFFDTIKILKYYASGIPMWQLRNWTLEAAGSDNPIMANRSFLEEVFRTLILSPFGTLIAPISAYNFFGNKVNRKKYMIVAGVYLLFSSLSGGGGRLAFIYFFGCFAFAFLLFNKDLYFKKYQGKKFKRYIVAFLIVGILIVVALTTVRSGSGSFIRSTYRYFGMAPTLLSLWLNQLKYIKHTYGMLTFFGVHSYFFRFIKVLGMNMLVPGIYDRSYESILNAEKFLQIGGGVGNAFVSPIYYFYIDGGIIAIIVFSVLFGFIVSLVFDKIRNKITVKCFGIYMLLMYAIFVSFMRVQTCIPSYWISYLVLYFLTINIGMKVRK